MTRHDNSVVRVLLAAGRRLYALRTVALAAATAVSIGVLLFFAWRLYEAHRDNATIAALEAGEDVAVDLRSASDEVMIARAKFLIDRDRRDEAQSLVDSSTRMTNAKLRSRLLYNHANARIRDAIGAIERSDNDKAIPLTRLAKDEYRLALRLDPGSWDAKFNYDVAMRIVRDFPGYDQEGEDLPPDAPTRLWTDLPGVPKGLP